MRRPFPLVSCPRAQRLVASGCLLFGASTTWAGDVRVYTDLAHPVTNAHSIPVIRLDEPNQIQAALSRGLARDPTHATHQVQDKLRVDAGQVSRCLSLAFQGVVDAWRVGILKVPAVVVDSHLVVYGDTDVAHALSLIAQYQGAPL